MQVNLDGYASAFQEEAISVRKLLLQEKQRSAELARRAALLEAALFGVLEMRRTHCCFCGKTLTHEDTVAWADSGLPARFLCCKDHQAEARMRLKDEVDARREHGR